MTGSGSDEVLPLFVYGTLLSGGSAEGMLEAFVVKRAPASASGRFVDTGAPYPGAVFGGVIERIDGELLLVEPSRFAMLIENLDAYEGVPSLFRRIRITVSTSDGDVEAYAYEWGGA